MYVGSCDKKVYALDGATGARKWEFATRWRGQSSPAIGADGTVYVGSIDSKVYALDGATGARKWEFATGGAVTSSPAIGADGTVYVGSADKKVYALEGVTGARSGSFPRVAGRFLPGGRGRRHRVCRLGRQEGLCAERRHRRSKWEFVTGGEVVFPGDRG